MWGLPKIFQSLGIWVQLNKRQIFIMYNLENNIPQVVFVDTFSAGIMRVTHLMNFVTMVLWRINNSLLHDRNFFFLRKIPVCVSNIVCMIERLHLRLSRWSKENYAPFQMIRYFLFTVHINSKISLWIAIY